MTTVLVMCGWPGCEAPELRPLDGDDYSFVRLPNRRNKFVPCCPECRERVHEAKREALVAQS